MAARKATPKIARRGATTGKTPRASGTSTDPRLLPGFQPDHFPLCDGGPAPLPETTDRVERRQIDFLAAYYRLNQLYARLEAIRHGASPEDDQPVLREIQRAIRDRDALEDKYEPEGFLGEPVMEGVFYRDIEFTYARRRQSYEPASSSQFSLLIPLPPPGANVEDWLQTHLAGVFPDLGAARAARSTGKPALPKPKHKPRPAAARGARAPKPKQRRR